jgi:hypothetical protein
MQGAHQMLKGERGELSEELKELALLPICLLPIVLITIPPLDGHGYEPYGL